MSNQVSTTAERIFPGDTNWPLTVAPHPFLVKIEEIFQKHTTKDVYDNVYVDLCGVPEVNEKNNAPYVKQVFAKFVANEEHFEHLLVKMSQKQTRLYSIIMSEPGFEVHHSEPGTFLIKRCLGHQDRPCNYPTYKTMSLGVTVVIFNGDLTQFLAVQEKQGFYKGWKAPTGSVDYEKEDEITAAVREVKEETKLDIKAEELRLVGMAPTEMLRGRSPDRNFVFTCKVNNPSEIAAQPEEIKKVEWLSVDAFLSSKLPVTHESRPLILQEVVRIAKEAMVNHQGWQSSGAFWGSGRPAKLYHSMASL